MKSQREGDTEARPSIKGSEETSPFIRRLDRCGAQGIAFRKIERREGAVKRVRPLVKTGGRPKNWGKSERQKVGKNAVACLNRSARVVGCGYGATGLQKRRKSTTADKEGTGKSVKERTDYRG